MDVRARNLHTSSLRYLDIMSNFDDHACLHGGDLVQMAESLDLVTQDHRQTVWAKSAGGAARSKSEKARMFGVEVQDGDHPVNRLLDTMPATLKGLCKWRFLSGMCWCPVLLLPVRLSSLGCGSALESQTVFFHRFNDGHFQTWQGHEIKHSQPLHEQFFQLYSIWFVWSKEPRLC